MLLAYVRITTRFPDFRFFSARFPENKTVQFLVQPEPDCVEWMQCPSYALPATAVKCGWDKLDNKPLYCGKSLSTEQWQHIGVVDEDMTLYVPVAKGQHPIRHFECEILCRVDSMYHANRT